MKEKIRVGIVDDHKILAEGLNGLIDESDIAEVVGVAHSARECRDRIAFWRPDVVLLDVSLPDLSGIEFCKELTGNYPTIKVLALTSHNEYAVVKQMLANGAMGYVVKNAMSAEILAGIKAVYDGQEFLSHEIDVLLKKQSPKPVWLTERERELLKLVAEGYTNIEIADKIFLSSETIKGYRKNLLLKLGAKNTAVLVRMALEQKLI